MRLFPFLSGAFFAMAWWVALDTLIAAKYFAHNEPQNECKGKSNVSRGPHQNISTLLAAEQFVENALASNNLTSPLARFIFPGHNGTNETCHPMVSYELAPALEGRHAFPVVLGVLAFAMVAVSPFPALRAASAQDGYSSDGEDADAFPEDALALFDDSPTAACGACSRLQCAQCWLFCAFTAHFASVMYGVVVAGNGQATWIDGAVTMHAGAVFVASMLWAAGQLNARKCVIRWSTAQRCLCFLRPSRKAPQPRQSHGFALLAREKKLHGGGKHR